MTSYGVKFLLMIGTIRRQIVVCKKKPSIKNIRHTYDVNEKVICAAFV